MQFLGSIFFLSVLFAQVPLNTEELSKKLQFYTPIETLQATFKQTKHLKEMGMKLESEGELKVHRPDRVVWQITKPGRVQLTLQGSDVILETGEGKEYKVDRFSLNSPMKKEISQGLLSMMAWLKLDIPMIQNSFTVSSIEGGGFRCEPKDKKAALFASLDFYVHSKGHLEQLILNEKSGDRIEIRFQAPQVTFKK